MAGLYPFFILGLRRTAEKAGILGLATFLAAIVAFAIPALYIGIQILWESLGLLFFFEIPKIIITPVVLTSLFAGCFYLACFMIPFFSASASDLYFRNDWRANSIILVSPLSSKDMFFGKFAVLFTVGLPVLLMLLPPLALIFVGALGGYLGFIQLVAIGLFVYSVSVFFLAGFTRRWEAGFFWLFLYPMGSILNGILYMTVLLANWIVRLLHNSYPSSGYIAVLPGSIGFPAIPTSMMALVVVVITGVLIVRKGTGEIEKMRTGLIPLGRLTEKTVKAYEKKKEPWYTPEFVRPGRVPKAQMEIFVTPGDKYYRLNSTDHVFNLLTSLAFFGKGTLLILVRLIPEFILESPIYRRHTARFRGYLEGYYEPSSTLKSRVVAAAILLPVLIFFSPFPWMIVTGLSTVNFSFMNLLLTVGLLVSLISPIDAYIRQARHHRESMAWESVIMAPIEGSKLIGGTFGVLLTHRFYSLLPSSIYILILGLYYPTEYSYCMVLLVLIHSIHFAGLSIASGISWQIARKWVAGLLLLIWGGATIWGVSWFIRGKYFIAGQVGTSELAIIGALSLGLVIVGILFQVVIWQLFDKYTRHPLERSVEEGG